MISFINFSVDCTIYTILAHRAFLEEFLLTPTKQVLQPKSVVEEKTKHNPSKINNLKQNWNAFGDWNFICGTRFINCSKYIENYMFYPGKCGPPLCAVLYSMGRCYRFGFGWPSFRWKVTRRNGWRYGVLVVPGREGDGAQQNLWVWCGGMDLPRKVPVKIVVVFSCSCLRAEIVETTFIFPTLHCILRV